MHTLLPVASETKVPRYARDDKRLCPLFIPYFISSYFQNGFFSPAGASALLLFASAPESSDIFSSCKRDEGACNSSSRYCDFEGLGYCALIDTSTVVFII